MFLHSGGVAPKGPLWGIVVKRINKMEYRVYILKSCFKERYYIGCTSNLEKRINEHNKGKTKSTKPYLPWEIIYSESFFDKNEAYKREWYLKHPAGYLEKIEIIKQFGRVA